MSRLRKSPNRRVHAASERVVAAAEAVAIGLRFDYQYEELGQGLRELVGQGYPESAEAKYAMYEGNLAVGKILRRQGRSGYRPAAGHFRAATHWATLLNDDPRRFTGVLHQALALNEFSPLLALASTKGIEDDYLASASDEEVVRFYLAQTTSLRRVGRAEAALSIQRLRIYPRLLGNVADEERLIVNNSLAATILENRAEPAEAYAILVQDLEDGSLVCQFDRLLVLARACILSNESREAAVFLAMARDLAMANGYISPVLANLCGVLEWSEGLTLLAPGVNLDRTRLRGRRL